MFDISDYTIENNTITLDIEDKAALIGALDRLIEYVSDIEKFNTHKIFKKESSYGKYYFSFYFKSSTSGEYYSYQEENKDYPSYYKPYISNEFIFFNACAQYPDLLDIVRFYLEKLAATLHLTKSVDADESQISAGGYAALALALADAQYLPVLAQFANGSLLEKKAVIEKYGLHHDVLVMYLREFFAADRSYKMVNMMRLAADYKKVLNESPKRFYDGLNQVIKLRSGKHFESQLHSHLDKISESFSADAPDLMTFLCQEFNVDYRFDIPDKKETTLIGQHEKFHHVYIEGGIQSVSGLRSALKKMLSVLERKSSIKAMQKENDEHFFSWDFYSKIDDSIEHLGKIWEYGNTFFNAAVSHKELRPLVLDYAHKITRQSERNYVLYYSCEDYAGSYATRALAVADKRYVVDCIRFLRTNDLSHEVYQSEHILSIIDAHGLCDETVSLIAFRLTAGGQHHDDDMQTIEERHKLSDYLNASSENMQYLLKELSKNYWLTDSENETFTYKPKSFDYEEIEFLFEGFNDKSLTQKIFDGLNAVHPVLEPLADQLLDFSNVTVAIDPENDIGSRLSSACESEIDTGLFLSNASFCVKSKLLLLIEAFSQGSYKEFDLKKERVNSRYIPGVSQQIIHIATNEKTRLRAALLNRQHLEREFCIFNEKKVLFQERAYLESLQQSPDGKWLGCISDHRVTEGGEPIPHQMRMTKHGKLQQTFESFGAAGDEWCFSSNGKYVALRHRYGADLFTTKNMQLLDDIDNVDHCAFNPAKNELAVVHNHHLTIYSLPDLFVERFTIDLFKDEKQVNSICYTPDGHYLVTEGFYKGATQVNFYDANRLVYCDSLFIDDRIVSLHISKKLKKMIVCTRKGRILQYSTEKIQKILKSISLPESKDEKQRKIMDGSVITYINSTAPIFSATVQDGQAYISMDEKILRIPTNTLDDYNLVVDIGSPCQKFTISQMGEEKLLAAQLSKKIKIYDVSNNAARLLWSYNCKSGTFALIPQQSLIAIADSYSRKEKYGEEHSRLTIYNYKTNKEIAKYEDIHEDLRSLILTADGEILIGCHCSLNTDSSCIYFWNTSTWEQYRAENINMGSDPYAGAHHLALNDKGNLLAAIDHVMLNIFDVKTGNLIEKFEFPKRNRYIPHAIIWSPCQNYLVAASWEQLYIFDVQQATWLKDKVYSPSINEVIAFGFSDDKTMLTLITKKELINCYWENLLKGELVKPQSAKRLFL